MRDSPPGSTQEACLDAFDEYSALSIFGADATIEIVDLPLLLHSAVAQW